MLIAIDVTVGLILVYLLYSLLTTIVQEGISTWLGFRARNLKRAIVQMLTDETKVNKLSVKGLASRVASIAAFNSRSHSGTLAEAFYNHPGIKYLGEGQWHRLPDNITSEKFAEVITDILLGDSYDGTSNPAKVIEDALSTGQKLAIANNQKGINITASVSNAPVLIEEETAYYLKRLLINANNDIDKFKKSLQTWYDDMMKQTTVWYKRNIQVWLFGIGMLIAIAFNVDTIKIARFLSNNKEARQEMVQLAIAAQKNYEGKEIGDSITNEVIKQNKQDIEAAQKILGNGWDGEWMWCYGECRKKTDTALVERANKKRLIDSIDVKVKKIDTDSTLQTDSSLKTVKIKLLDSARLLKSDIAIIDEKVKHCQQFTIGKFFEAMGQASWWLRFLGWVLTAFAISLGAPFWFDLLNKFIRLRSGISTAESSKAMATTTGEAVNPKA
ncbi:MAG: hypothetical protein ACO1PI_02200 [Bacteroidota bacterium]